MNAHYLFLSMTRIAKLRQIPFEVAHLPRKEWAGGDYVVGEVLRKPSGLNQVELFNGRMTEAMEGDLLVGAFGERYATMEATGSWKRTGKDGRMHVLTGAGLFGKMSSRAPFIPNPIDIRYQGHVLIKRRKATMHKFARKSHTPSRMPVFLIIGSSMSAGKTTAARVIIRLLAHMGAKVVGVKLTGAGRYRDILAMADAGAKAVYDFVDVGLPSTVVKPEVFKAAAQNLMGLVNEEEADLAMIEIGASPLEPYNGEAAIALIRDQLRFTLLAASDPYSVVGIMRSFDIKPDLVTGPATNTVAGLELIEKLGGPRAMNILDPSTHGELKQWLKVCLPDINAAATTEQ